MPILYPGTWPTTSHVSDEEIEDGIVAALLASTTLAIDGPLGVKQIAVLPELPDGALPNARPALCPQVWVRCGDATEEKIATQTNRLTRTVEVYVRTVGLSDRETVRQLNHAIRNDAVAAIFDLDGTTTLFADDRQLFIGGEASLSKVLCSPADRKNTNAVSGARIPVYTFRGIEA